MKNQYVQYRKRMLFSTFLNYIVWTALSTFMIVGKNAIGVASIPIFELLLYVAWAIGIRVAHSNIICYKQSVLLDIVGETIFLVSIYFILIYNNEITASSGVAVYLIIIYNSISKEILVEKERNYEDIFLINSKYKNILKIIRKGNLNINMIGGLIGTGVSLIVLTYIGIELYMFTLILLLLNVIQNMYDYYLWNTYIKEL